MEKVTNVEIWVTVSFPCRPTGWGLGAATHIRLTHNLDDPIILVYRYLCGEQYKQSAWASSLVPRPALETFFRGRSGNETTDEAKQLY